MGQGRVNPDQTLEHQGISGLGEVYYNLIEMAIGAEINGKLVHQPEGAVPLLEQTSRIDESVAVAAES